MQQVRAGRAPGSCESVRPVFVLLRYFLLVLIGFLGTLSTNAAELLFDGDFESGTLAGWNPGGTGSAIVTRYGSCFSDRDTRGLSIRGRYAGLLRGSAQAPDAGPTLTSKPFVAGLGLTFISISEERHLQPTPPAQRALEAIILDRDGLTLARTELSTATAGLPSGCPSARTDFSFSRHYVSTQKWRGKQIRLQFRQHREAAQHGGFTLIDQVEMVPPGSPSISPSLRVEAGLLVDPATYTPYLQADLDSNARAIAGQFQFSWLINGEPRERPYFNPCLNDLPAGHYVATVYVRERGALLASDTLEFSLPGAAEAVARGSQTSVARDPVCNQTSVPEIAAANRTATIDR